MINKKNVIFLILIAIAFTLTSVTSHSPKLATYKLVQIQDGLWEITISTSSSCLNKALKVYSDKNELELNKTNYNKILTQYLKSKFLIEINGSDKIVLDQLAIKLGSHEINIKALINYETKTISKIKFKIPQFGENIGQQNIVKFYYQDKIYKSILSLRNGFQYEFSNF
tara:strand:+ start:465 stop:971 length:507 start_codon:yes stop_codon:yes gene_type:complete